jgi:hypothetical protein
VLDLYFRARDPRQPLQRRARIELFRQVTEFAPSFAPAWAALASASAMELRHGAQPHPSTVGKASVLAAANSALALDRRAGLAYAALALLQPFGEYAARKALLQQAVAASSNDPHCLLELCWFEHWVGRFQASREAIERAWSTDPLFPAVAEARANATAVCGDYAESCRQFDASMRCARR